MIDREKLIEMASRAIADAPPTFTRQAAGAVTAVLAELERQGVDPNGWQPMPKHWDSVAALHRKVLLLTPDGPVLAFHADIPFKGWGWHEVGGGLFWPDGVPTHYLAIPALPSTMEGAR